MKKLTPQQNKEEWKPVVGEEKLYENINLR